MGDIKIAEEFFGSKAEGAMPVKEFEIANEVGLIEVAALVSNVGKGFVRFACEEQTFLEAMNLLV